ncbi:hypothetical protein [Kribbella sp. NPDC050470]|uniref:hypothetical protein n=1 Tax=unclassified Kribbella TaxID=2644121 RepID=UPI0037AA0F54
MTDLLRDMLAEQADVEPPALDLDGIVATGDRRLRRRRVASVAGAALVTLAVVAGGITGVRMVSGPDDPPVATFAERRATYAVGSEIHYGADVISVAPHKVSAFVQVDSGFVFTTEEGGVFVANKNGVDRIEPDNTTDQLTADDRGNLVGWVELRNNDADSVVYDVAAGREMVRTATGNDFPPGGSIAVGPRVVAIDGDTAYFGTLDGLYRWNVKTNKGELVAEVPPNAVRAVVDGQMVYQQPLTQPGPGIRLTIGTTLEDSGGPRFTGQQAFLSPTAKYLATQPYDPRLGIDPGWAALHVFEVGSNRSVGQPYTYSTVVFGQWLDDDTFTAVGEVRSSRSSQADLLTCSAETFACKVAAPAFSTFTFSTTPPRVTPFAVPTGSRIIDLYS